MKLYYGIVFALSVCNTNIFTAEQLALVPSAKAEVPQELSDRIIFSFSSMPDTSVNSQSSLTLQHSRQPLYEQAVTTDYRQEELVLAALRQDKIDNPVLYDFRPRPAKLSVKTSIAFVFLGTVSLLKLVLSALDTYEHFNVLQPATTRGSFFPIAELTADTACVTLLYGLYRCNKKHLR